MQPDSVLQETNKDVKFNFRTPELCFLSPSTPGEADRAREEAGRKESPVPGAPIVSLTWTRS